MKVFLDTSVMVAAFWGDHTGHDASLQAFTEATRQTGSFGIHSLAEVYATMTALPVRPALGPDQVFLFVQQISERLTPVSLDQAEYLGAIRELSERGLAGGRVYDALLLACARKAQTETILTWDLKHFRQLAPDLADRIHTP